MKIVAVTTRVVNAEMRNWVFVRVETDQDGLFGWGEATLEWKTKSVVGAIEDLAPLIIGRDPRDIEYEASLVGARTQCEIKRGQMNVTLVMRIAVQAGPSVTGAPTQVPYFVRVLTGAGTVAQGQDFIAGFKLSAANPRGQSQEELALTLPYSEVSDLAAYRIAVGLKPTPEELDYNRRSDRRP